MSASALSDAQFGSLRSQTPEETETPLPGSAQTYTSSQRAFVFRPPRGVSGQEAAYGSFFKFPNSSSAEGSPRNGL